MIIQNTYIHKMFIQLFEQFRASNCISTQCLQEIFHTTLLCIIYVLFIVTCKVKFARLHQIFKFFKELSASESSFLISSYIPWYLRLSHISHFRIRHFFLFFYPFVLLSIIFLETESLSEFSTDIYIFYTTSFKIFINVISFNNQKDIHTSKI